MMREMREHHEWEYIPYGADGIDWTDIDMDTYRRDGRSADSLPRSGDTDVVIYTLRTLRMDEMTIAQREAMDIFRGDRAGYMAAVTSVDGSPDASSIDIRDYCDNPSEINDVMWFWLCKFAIVSMSATCASYERRYMRRVLTDESVMTIDSLHRQLIADEVLRRAALSEEEKKQ